MRKAWKEVGLGLLNLLLVVAVIAAAQPLLQKYLRNAGAFVMALLCLAAYVAASKWIERRTPTELAPNRALPELAVGLLTGLVLFSLVMTALWFSGVYHPAGIGSSNQLAKGFVLALFAGILEELLFRGLLFRLCSKLLGTWGALAFTAALFGAAHAGNRGATLSSSVAIALEAGILLGAAYAATARLWLPIGLHIGWNFTESSLFGMSVSGTSMPSGLIRGSLTGSRLLTGGAFGPEASIVAVIVCLVAALYFLRRTVKLRRAEPPIWRKFRQTTPNAPVAQPSAL